MTGRGALSGRRVLELADESGVYCGKLLADMGADVIKIEAPGGDPPEQGGFAQPRDVTAVDIRLADDAHPETCIDKHLPNHRNPDER